MGFVWRKHLPGMSSIYSTCVLLSPLLLFVVTGSDNVCSGESCTFLNTINNIVVGKSHVLVATENSLYLLDHTLSLLTVTSPRTDPNSECGKIYQKGAAGNNDPVCYNKLLLVYNDTVLSCWNRGECFERDFNNLTNVIGTFKTTITCDKDHPVTGFLIFDGTTFNLAVASIPCWSFWKNGACNKINLTQCNAISIKKKAKNKIVDLEDSSVALKDYLKIHFIDSFKWEDNLFFLSFSNDGGSMSILILKRKGFKDVTYYSQINLMCLGTEQNGVILSSFKFKKSGSYFWALIFSKTNITKESHKTALCIFNITRVTEDQGCVWYSMTQNQNCENITLYPVHNTSTLTHWNLNAVYAVEVQDRMVFFLGTGNGQLLKVALDSEWKAACPEILYELKDESPVFRTIVADPVDSDYIYLSSLNEIRRIKVSNCDRFKSCTECLSAVDPYCGWCHSQKRCTLKHQCQPTVNQRNWISISDQDGKCLEVRFFPIDRTEINIAMEVTTMTVSSTNLQCWVKNNSTGKVLCTSNTIKPASMSCSCQVPSIRLSNQDHLEFEVIVNNSTSLSETLQFQRCDKLSRCLDCISNGCLWCTENSKCASPLATCKGLREKEKCTKKTTPTSSASTSTEQINITSVNPERISYLGKSKVTITGQNLQTLSTVLLFGTSSCQPQEGNILNIHNDTFAIISLPRSNKEAKNLCLKNDESKCSSPKTIYYESLPTCAHIFPNTTWLSGGRRISISGKNFDFVDYVIFSDEKYERNDITCLGNRTHCQVSTPEFTEVNHHLNITFNVVENLIKCGKLLYKDNPTFTDFLIFNDEASELELRIKKAHDELNIEENEIDVLIYYFNKTYPCEVKNITQNAKESTIYCKAKKDFDRKIDESKIKIKVSLGAFTTTLEKKPINQIKYILLVIPVVVIIIIIFVAACLVTRYKSNQMNNQLSKQLEMLECDIRQEIRDGFAELQMDKVDCAVETLGTIPFYDYKHFAQRILFPEECTLNFREELCENIPSPFHQKNALVELESITALRVLFENKSFLVPLIHTLEKESNFTIKDRCMFASFLTIKFQNNLIFLTELLEVLIRDLMEQTSNKHPKLMLRRTESVVEKLLTNWMSTVLYGFLRECVGEPLYLLVNILNQRVHKGPIDVITSKALYTLNEDWLLWQMPEFTSIELNVNFPAVSENESEENVGLSMNVTVLDCDTIGQAKEKILQAFLTKNGYNYGYPLSDMSIELHHGQQRKELQDVDTSSVILENEITKLNTIQHYKIENGAIINVVLKKDCNKTDIEYSNRYCHLISPNSEESEHLQATQNKDKQKFKVKELYLTKLLSTKVAIHSVVEKLFQSIWKLPTSKPPIAIKYFFDFLDAQAESKKITDPDVLHIWKTNSLPLRFWVNILKNPQFVFAIKKTPHLESCLSVIAQAFMDAFSLSEQLLGKAAPTNKLLYAKDIPQFKEEVKCYYKAIRDAPPVSSEELKEFLLQESKKHEHEFKEDVALLELYKYIEKYYSVILRTLEKEPGLESELKQLLTVKDLMESRKKCTWE